MTLPLLALLGAALPSFGVSTEAAGASRPPTFCNPLDLPYAFQGSALAWRTAADPAAVLFRGEYWLFATGNEGCWRSADLTHWRPVPKANLPAGHDAPGVLARGGKLYWTAIGTGVYETDDPASGRWRLVGDSLSQGDPDLFQDDDGRVYLYTGCGVNGPISGREVDPGNGFKPLTEPKRLLVGMTATHGGEIMAEPTDDPPYREDYAWIEGPWMTKHEGKYYLQYAAPATESKAYGDGVYVGDHPLGPFAYAQYSPFSFKPTGFVGGAGHSTTFQDAAGRYWRVSTMTLSVRHIFERRLGLFPAWFTGDGQMVCDTNFGDYPQYVPGVVKDPSKGDAPGWMLLSYRKRATASSTLDSHPVEDAFDEDIRTWWSAKTGDPGEWLKVDLGKACRVEAVQVNFADEGSGRGRRVGEGYGYRLDVSADGTSWTTVVDRSADPRDAPHDYAQLDRPVLARYARITNAHSPGASKFSLSGLRLFGSGLGRPPRRVAGIQVWRDPSDGRRATVAWQPSSGADGYVVRYGIAKDRLFGNYQVYGARTLRLHTLNAGVPYYFTVDAFSDSGVTLGATAVFDGGSVVGEGPKPDFTPVSEGANAAKEINAFLNADARRMPPEGAVLFMGSSTVTLWKTLARDFSEIPVINRGFGGSLIQDSTQYADRIAVPYRPKMIVLFAGTNDLAYGGKTPLGVLQEFEAFVAKVHAALPDTRIAYISINPTVARWKQEADVLETNRLIEAFILGSGSKTLKLSYIDSHSGLLANGRPQPALEREDGLHLNAEGYRVFTSIIKPRILALATMEGVRRLDASRTIQSP